MKNSMPILLVEDDRADVLIARKAFSDLGITNEVIHTVNGEAALEYLRNEDNIKPCVILLDLNMPRMGGIEFLEIFKVDELLKNIPVVILTTSQERRDIAESFKLGVAGYIVKPINYKEFVEAIKIINNYWTLSILPGGSLASLSV